MDDVAVGLEGLMKQLNDFKPASETIVGDTQKQISAQVDARLNLQSERIDNVNVAVERGQKAAEDNSEMSQNLLIGMENMGDSIKQLREEMVNLGEPSWREDMERKYNETATELMQEVSLYIPAISEPSQTFSSPLPMLSFPL